MSNWSSGDVISNGIRIHYHRTGVGDKPVLVMCHGFSDNGLCWTPIAEKLEDDYDIVLPDARGHGLSEAPESGYGPEDMAADLIGLVEALGLENPAYMGHSMGGSQITAAAAMRPDLPACLVLSDPGWHNRDEGSREDWAERADEMMSNILKMKGMSREELIAQCREESPTWPEEELDNWAEAKQQLSPNIAKGFAERIASQPWQEQVAKFECPALLLTANTEKGSIITPEMAKEAASLWHSGRVVNFSEAGHNIRREAPTAYVKAVKEFLAEHLG